QQRTAGPPPQPRPASVPPLAQLRFRRVCVSSREDRGRYRGRRRAPTPPRTRYAAVGLTAFVGAGVVALGTAAALPGTSSDTTGLTAANAAGAFTVSDLADRQAAVDRANRSDRGAAAAAVDNPDTGLWLLPLRAYTVAAP